MQHFLLSSNWDVWYASQRSVGLLFLFPGSISASLLLIAGTQLSAIFDVVSSTVKLTNPSTNDLPRTFSTLFSSKSVSSNWSDLCHCQIDLMTSLNQTPLHSNPHWLMSSSLNLSDSPPLYYNMIVRLMSEGDTENLGFSYWLVSFNNIAINLSQYFTTNLSTCILYSCQHAWETLQLG